MTNKRVQQAVVVAAVLAVGVGVYAVQALIAPQDQRDPSCLELAGAPDKCRFAGVPMRAEGHPIFLSGRPLPFHPLVGRVDFVDSDGAQWTAPERTLTDGASIPTIFTPLVGAPLQREFQMAAALHDAYCGIGNETLETFQSRPWQEVHRMFYDALLVGGTPPQRAKIMYAAVYLGGPRWDDPDRMLDDMPKDMMRHELEAGVHWIMAEDPDHAEIAAWFDKREPAMMAAMASRTPGN